MPTRSASHINKLERSSSGHFSKECSCIQHEEWSEGASDNNKIAININGRYGQKQ